MSKVLGKYELDKITERLELIIQFAKIVSKKNKIEKQIKEKYFLKSKKKQIHKDIEKLEDKLLELHEKIQITFDEYVFKGLTSRQIDEGESIEAYGKDWIEVQKKQRRESEIGKVILNLLKDKK
jgi:predicted nuclease with TOPRIM domain